MNRFKWMPALHFSESAEGKDYSFVYTFQLFLPLSKGGFVASVSSNWHNIDKGLHATKCMPVMFCVQTFLRPESALTLLGFDTI